MTTADSHDRVRPGSHTDNGSHPGAESRVELLKIGDFAKVAGTNLRTLRYYEELGLLRPATRSDGGFRYYRRTDANRLAMIRNLQELGLPLDRIRDLISPKPDGADRREWICAVRRALETHDRLIAKRIATLEEQRERLKESMAKLEDCESCVHSPSQENNYCEPCQRTGESLPESVSALF